MRTVVSDHSFFGVMSEESSLSDEEHVQMAEAGMYVSVFCFIFFKTLYAPCNITFISKVYH